MITCTKKTNGKMNAYKLTFEDGRTYESNFKKNFAYAVVFNAQGGSYPGQWMLQGYASDLPKAQKTVSRCKSMWSARRRGRYYSPAVPVTVKIIEVTAA